MDRKDGLPLKPNIICNKDTSPVNAQHWSKLDIPYLLDQLQILNARLVTVQEMGKPMLVKQIQAGIEQLQKQIATKPLPTEYL